MKRRSVLKAGLASSVLSLVGVNGFARTFDLQNKIQPKAVVTDARFPSSITFGAHAAPFGIEHLSSKGDITAIWLKHLDPIWREGKASVIGLTTQDQLFCLERLAWDRGMQVLLRVEHHDSGRGSIAHKIEAPSFLAERTVQAIQNEKAWPSELAFLLGSCSPNQLVGRCAYREVTSKGKLNEQLVTWVIAPATRSFWEPKLYR